MDFRETILEHNTTQWEGARLRITLAVPQVGNTMSSQMIIDREDINTLKHLNRPEEIDLMKGIPQQIAFTEWESKHKQAERLIDIISNKIALHLARHLASEL